MRENEKFHLAFSLIFVGLSILWISVVRFKSDNDILFISDLHQSMAEHALDAFDYMHDPNRIVAPLDVGPYPVIRRWCIKSPIVDSSNTEWQSLVSDDIELHLYNAYADHRAAFISPDAKSFIQIIGVVRREMPHDSKIYCHIWRDDVRLATIETYQRVIWQRAWDPRDRFYLPILVSCPLDNDYDYDAISLSFTACPRTVSNKLLVARKEKNLKNDGRQQKVVVCVKGLDFNSDNSLRLVEWIEALKLMGADKIMIYFYAMHWRTEKVLQFYNGFVEAVRLTVPGNAPNNNSEARSDYIWRNRQQKRRNELVPYNDCLYRHIYTHNWALIIDTDELVVPLKHNNWKDILQTIVNETNTGTQKGEDLLTSLSTINVFKFDELTRNFNESIPEYMHMMRHRMRTKRLSKRGDYGKCFMNTRTVTTVFNHFALHKQRPMLKPTRYINSDLVLKLHYKKKCPIESSAECPKLYRNPIEDPSLDRYSDELIKNVKRTVSLLNLAE